MEQTSSKQTVKNKKVLVLGLAKTGLSVVKKLAAEGAIVTVNDKQPLDENKAAQDLIEHNVRIISGYHPIELLDEDFAFMVKNPGIPYSNPMVQRAQELNLPIYTDIELLAWFNQAEVIGITGSNGKTTTTSLLGEILQGARELTGKTEVAGNIGIPALTASQGLSSQDCLVLELSSFQLMGIETFRPHIAAIIDLYPTHLDYHGSIENYLAAKWRITKNQGPDDYLLLNYDQEILWQKAKESSAQVIPISIESELEKGAWYNEKEGTLMWGSETVLKREDLFLPGKHNVQNALVALAIAKLLGVSNASIQAACSQFHGVKHRIQFVDQIKDRRFYNDSKATNNEASITALRSFKESLVWIAGGLDRGNGVEELLKELGHVHALVAMGETQDKFIDLANKAGISQISVAKNIEEATQAAYRLSQPGDVILLSPACASWDQYPNFEVRGQRFIDAVAELKNQES
ncbi:UDP-N-acetylmuramoyl-L-alanine--D-glutamate ligase [Aerococcus mictus]|uniref:UDP-N-acetylmuramoyl-L-alanine--D-glutamate ligase n=1 Tax=Aerococcus mictus TaxID=2976810 RepID=UPI001244B1E4|nr:UDP-N-acetylmuramoyl-L-alanine--D-glutamate ligase [Aerococcus mictus]KAA9293699.1 UDP-N-acetylmuramoyl-L-alanine--D-glutamate ligase [Aerococcus mictus]